MDEEEQIRNYNDDQERKQREDYRLGSRKMPLSNNVLMLLGGLLQPQTEGLDHINLDMSFTNLDAFDLAFIENSSFIMGYCSIHALNKPLYTERNKLSTRLISKRSFNAKSMELFTNTVAEQKNVFQDKTEKKGAFARLLGGKKNKDEE